MMGESSTKPYLIRALHEWCTDNGYTPYIIVQVTPRTTVPLAHVCDGQITLNIGYMATNKLLLGNEFIEFQARFNSVIENISVPVNAISAIYARETGAGMGFEVQSEDETQLDAIPGNVSPTRTSSPKNPSLELTPATVIEGESNNHVSSATRPRLTIVK